MTNTALVVGGTGPTGPHVVNGLIERGYQVTILHSGRHESDLVPSQVNHLHTDAFDVTQVARTLHGASFDLVVSMYGRLRDLAALFEGRCQRFISVGGAPVYRGFGWPAANLPVGMPILLAQGLEREIELVSLPWVLARPAWPWGEATHHHRVLSTELLRSELGYRDVLGVEKALPATARWLADHPVERGSVTEAGLQDAFDYQAEDRLMDAWHKALIELGPVAEAADHGWVDRYAHTSVDAKLGIDRGRAG